MKIFLKRIYDIIPFKKEAFLILRSFWKPKPDIYKHFHFKGIITVPINAESSFKIKHYGYQVENDIFWSGLTGEWEKASLDIWIKLSKNANVVFDVGANTGVYSLIAKTMNQNAAVYALEPVKRVFEKLITNNQLNNFNINCIPIAASNYKGTANIYDTDSDHTYSVTVNKNLNTEKKETRIIEIQTTTLDDIIEQEKISKIDLIKIDVETHEPEVLEGYKKYLLTHKPSILIEILSDEIGEKVQEIVAPLNYLYFNIGESSGIKKVDNITKSDHFNYLLCDNETARYLKLI